MITSTFRFGFYDGLNELRSNRLSSSSSFCAHESFRWTILSFFIYTFGLSWSAILIRANNGTHTHTYKHKHSYTHVESEKWKICPCQCGEKNVISKVLAIFALWLSIETAESIFFVTVRNIFAVHNIKKKLNAKSAHFYLFIFFCWFYFLVSFLLCRSWCWCTEAQWNNCNKL